MGDNQPPSKITFDKIKEAFIVKYWSSFHLLGKELDYLHLKDFLKYECELYLKQPLTPPHHIIDLPSKLDSGQLSLSLEIINFATFALII